MPCLTVPFAFALWFWAHCLFQFHGPPSDLSMPITLNYTPFLLDRVTSAFQVQYAEICDALATHKHVAQVDDTIRNQMSMFKRRFTLVRDGLKLIDKIHKRDVYLE